MRKGFTLLEISIVVLMFALFSALVVPRLISMRRGDESRKFTIELPGMIRNVRAAAIQSSETRVLAYNSQSDELVIQDAEGQASGETLSVPSDVEVSGARIGKDDATGTDWEIRFYPDGSCDGGGIEFNFGGKAMALQLFAQTGAGRWTTGELPEVGTDEWQAGELEQRVPEGGQ